MDYSCLICCARVQLVCCATTRPSSRGTTDMSLTTLFYVLAFGTSGLGAGLLLFVWYAVPKLPNLDDV